MSRGRGLFKEIWNNFYQSLKPRKFEGNLMGTDHLGNKYYEIPPEHNRNRRSRWFMPEGGEAVDTFDQLLPAEWEAWLRGRRVNPPTVEEILKNQNYIKSMEEISKKISAEKSTENIKSVNKKGFESFPKYDEYELPK